MTAAERPSVSEIIRRKRDGEELDPETLAGFLEAYRVGDVREYQMAAFLGVFGVTMLIQFVSYLFQAVADMRDEPGHVDHAPVTQ